MHEFLKSIREEAGLEPWEVLKLLDMVPSDIQVSEPEKTDERKHGRKRRSTTKD